MKSTTNELEKYFSVKEISQIMETSTQTVRDRIVKYNLKSVWIYKCFISGFICEHYLFDKIAFAKNEYYFEIKRKPKKPYFEFASVIVESKINKHGID